MKRAQSLMLLQLILGAQVGYAQGKTILVSQKDKAFNTDTVEISVGDSVEFKNDDKITHNVFSSTAAIKFDLKTQKPGLSSVVKFDTEGEGEVRCAIHPQMKLKLKVKKK